MPKTLGSVLTTEEKGCVHTYTQCELCHLLRMCEEVEKAAMLYQMALPTQLEAAASWTEQVGHGPQASCKGPVLASSSLPSLQAILCPVPRVLWAPQPTTYICCVVKASLELII